MNEVTLSRWGSATRKDQTLLLRLAAGAPETAVMYQHLSSFQPLDLKYDTFCEYAGRKEVDTWFIDTIRTEVEID